MIPKPERGSFLGAHLKRTKSPTFIYNLDLVNGQPAKPLARTHKDTPDTRKADRLVFSHQLKHRAMLAQAVAGSRRCAGGSFDSNQLHTNNIHPIALKVKCCPVK